jgi:hypothetical protein
MVVVLGGLFTLMFYLLSSIEMVPPRYKMLSDGKIFVYICPITGRPRVMSQEIYLRNYHPKRPFCERVSQNYLEVYRPPDALVEGVHFEIISQSEYNERYGWLPKY